MTAAITSADQAAAHALLMEHFECVTADVLATVGHTALCVAVAGLHADARTAGENTRAARERRMVAAYLIDRADQHDTDRWLRNPLMDAAKALMSGEFEQAVRHGELDDAELLARVDGFAARRGT